MRFSNILLTGRQVLRSTLLASGVLLAALAIGCGDAAQEAKIDQSATADPAAMGTGLEGGTAAPAAPAATPEAAPAEKTE